MGPDEPHAASIAWPDGVLEKQELDLENFEFDRAELEGFLNSKLPSHPKLYRGQLRNGLRYLILPNKVPPSRYGSLTVTIFKLLDNLSLIMWFWQSFACWWISAGNPRKEIIIYRKRYSISFIL